MAQPQPHSPTPAVTTAVAPSVSPTSTIIGNMAEAGRGPSPPETAPDGHAHSCRSSRKTRQVTFDPAVRAKFTLHLNNFTRQELQQSWYCADDIAAIRAEARQAVRQMDALEKQHGHHQQHEPHAAEVAIVEECRGLECRTRRGLDWRNRHKRRSRRAVLEEQRAQQAEGVHFPDTLARVYKLQSQACVEAALKMGRMDQLVARRLWSGDHVEAAAGHDDHDSAPSSSSSRSNLEGTALLIDEVIRTINTDATTMPGDNGQPSPSSPLLPSSSSMQPPVGQNRDSAIPSPSLRHSMDSESSFSSTISSPAMVSHRHRHRRAKERRQQLKKQGSRDDDAALFLQAATAAAGRRSRGNGVGGFNGQSQNERFVPTTTMSSSSSLTEEKKQGLSFLGRKQFATSLLSSSSSPSLMLMKQGKCGSFSSIHEMEQHNDTSISIIPSSSSSSLSSSSFFSLLSPGGGSKKRLSPSSSKKKRRQQQEKQLQQQQQHLGILRKK